MTDHAMPRDYGIYESECIELFTACINLDGTNAAKYMDLCIRELFKKYYESIKGSYSHTEIIFKFLIHQSEIGTIDYLLNFINKLITEKQGNLKHRLSSLYGKIKNTPLQINIAIAAMTKDQAEIMFNIENQYANHLMSIWNIDSFDNNIILGIKERYGDTIKQWRPLYNGNTVEDTISDVVKYLLKYRLSKQDINDERKIEIDIFSILDEDKMNRPVKIIIIDEISLICRDICNKIDDIRGQKRVIVSPLPIEPFHDHGDRNVRTRQTWENLDNYNMLGVRRYFDLDLELELNTGGEIPLKRWLLHAMKQLLDQQLFTPLEDIITSKQSAMQSIIWGK
jgi:hypothetical protein